MAKQRIGLFRRGAQVIGEVIGRAAPPRVAGLWSSSVSTDETRTDYAFWDRFRRGTAQGYEFSGLFARPIAQIVTSWVMGLGLEPQLETDDSFAEDNVTHTNRLLKKLSNRLHGMFVQMVEDLFSLGDQYVVINLDGSLSIPSPDLVEAEYDLFGEPTAYTITTRRDKVTVIDQYRLDGRTLTIKQGQDVEIIEFENLTGRIPVVHLRNDRGSNEANGRPIFEGLLALFSRYNRLMRKMIDGAELMGNPIPTFEGLEDIDETIAANSEPTKEEYTDQDGNVRSRVRIAFDRLSALFVGKGGGFKFSAPAGGFTNDIRNTLKSLFLLVLEFTRIPEVIWGNELSSSRATAGEQMKTWHMFAQARRVALEGQGADDELGMIARDGLLAIMDIWLRTRALTDPRIIVAPVTIAWPELSDRDEELRLKWVDLLHTKGVLTDVEMVRQSNIIDDPEGEVERARAEVDERQDPYERAVDELLQPDETADITEAEIEAA